MSSNKQMGQVFVERMISAFAWVPFAIAVSIAPLFIWWAVEPMPLEIKYVAPYFVDQPVSSAEEAAKHYVTAVQGGTDVYRYIEFCVNKPFSGTARRSWVNEAMVWHAPDVPTQLSREEGCRHTNVKVPVPTSNPTRSFFYVQKLEIYVNPLRDEVVIDYPPIPLTILK